MLAGNAGVAQPPCSPPHTHAYTQGAAAAAHLAGGLVVGAHDQLHAVRLELEALEEVEDVQLGRVKRQALHLDHAVVVGVAALGGEVWWLWGERQVG
jgi:hypothetical protein